MLWDVVLCNWCDSRFNLEHYLLILNWNIEHIYIHALWYPEDMCNKMWENLFIYTAKQDKLTKGSVCETKRVIIQHASSPHLPPNSGLKWDQFD